MKLFHKHAWSIVEWAHVSVFMFSAHEGHPDRVDTRFGMVCYGCGKVKTERVKSLALDAEAAMKLVEARGWKLDDTMFRNNDDEEEK